MYEQANQLLPTPLLHNYGRVAELPKDNTRGNGQLHIDTKRTTLASTSSHQVRPGTATASQASLFQDNRGTISLLSNQVLSDILFRFGLIANALTQCSS